MNKKLNFFLYCFDKICYNIIVGNSELTKPMGLGKSIDK